MRRSRTSGIAVVASFITVAAIGGATLWGVDVANSADPVTQASCNPTPDAIPTNDGVSLTNTCLIPTPPPSTVTETTTAPAPPASTVTLTPTPTPTTAPTTPTTAPTTSAPPVGNAVIGASLGQPLPDPETLDAVRFYSASWTSKLQTEYNKGTRVFVISTKDTTTTNTVNMVRSAPSDVEFYITAHHEPDDDIKNGSLSPTSWCNTMNAFGRALAAYPNVEFGPIHNGSYGKAAWTTDSAPCDKTLWDFWGMDRYSPNYESAATQFAEGRDYAEGLGLPLVIGETGADPSNATAQKTFATQARAWSLDPANDAAVVLWWQQTGYTFSNATNQHAFLG